MLTENVCVFWRKMNLAADLGLLQSDVGVDENK